MMPPTAPIEDRFWPKVMPEPMSGCWLWTAALNSHGYGRIGISGTRSWALAHRVAYEMVVGPIPEGLELDHLCRTPACVNPGHLEPVTHSENVRRGRAPLARRRTHCPQGHPLEGENLYATERGGRKCRTCIRAALRRSKAKKRAERLRSSAPYHFPAA